MPRTMFFCLIISVFTFLESCSDHFFRGNLHVLFSHGMSISAAKTYVLEPHPH